MSEAFTSLQSGNSSRKLSLGMVSRINQVNLYRCTLSCMIALGGLIGCEPPPPCPSDSQLQGELPPTEEAGLRKVAGKVFEGACVIPGPHGPLMHGFSKVWYRGGRVLQSHYTYEGGVKNGEYMLYYPDGKLRESGNYRFGLQHGRYKTFHRNGKPHIEGEFQDGKKSGDFTIYSNNGMHVQKGPYFLGMRHGLWEDTYLPLSGEKLILSSHYHYGRTISQ